MGEYVEGAWDSIDYQGSSYAMESKCSVTTNSVEGNTLYDIPSTNELSKDELIAIANSMR